MERILKRFNNQLVLVTGATGFTGQALCRKLAKAGARIRAIARKSSNISVLDDVEIDWIYGNVFDQDVLAIAAENINYVFHVAAAFNEEMESEEDYRKVHVYSTQILAKLVTGKPEFKRFLHVSTVGVHGHIEIERADESYRFSTSDAYQRTKLEAEKWLTQYSIESGLPYAVVRPGPIYGPGDKRLLKIFKMANMGFVLMLGKGKGIFHLVHVDDLTNIFLLAASKDKALGEVFIAVSDDAPISIIEIGKIIGKHIGKRTRTIRLPLWPFYLAADISTAVFPRLGLKPPIYRRRVDFYTKDRKFNNRKVRELLGYTSKMDNETGLAQTVRWYQKQGLI
jgi:nucleoside-diphosphate-sugar epimerase